MPYKLARSCRRHGCPNLTNDKSGYCPEHKKEAQQQQDKTRGSSTSRGYDNRWRKARKQFLSNHPLCIKCEEEGRVVAAVIVDHITPAKGSPILFWDETNWQPLCEYHHNLKTAKEDGAFGNSVREEGGGGGCKS